MRASALLVVVGAALAAGVAGWLVLGGAEGGREAHEDDEGRVEASAQAPGATLAGHAKPLAGASAAIEGDFRIPGKVLDAQGQPVAGVAVTVRRTGDAWPNEDSRRWRWNPRAALERAFEDAAAIPDEGQVEASATSGADGTFHLLVHRRGSYTARAEPQAPAVGTEGSWYLNDTPPTTPLVLRVVGGSALRGRVVDGQDRGVAAIVRASATLANETGWWGSRPTRTDGGTGAFSFAAVPDGKVSLDVSIPGRLRLTGRVVTAPHAGEVVIRIDTGAVLAQGRVRDLTGAGVPGARVLLTLNAVVEAPQTTEALNVRYFAVADAEGAYTVSGPLGGPLSQVEVSAPGYLYASAAPPLATWSGLELVPGKEAVLDLTLWKGGTVGGRALEQGTGTPLAGVKVHLLPSAVDGRITRPPALEAVTDALGRYHVEGVPVGRSVLLVQHPTHFLAALEALPRSGGNDMVFFDGMPSSGGPPRDLTVFVEQEGQRVVRDLELVKGLPVSGRVVDAKGLGVEGAQVNARGTGLGNLQWQWGLQNQPSLPPLATSGPDGRFSIPGLPPRKDWVLVAKKTSLVGEPCAPFALAADAPAPEIVLKLVTGGTVAGRVLDDRGNGLPNVEVNCWSQSGDGLAATSASATTGEDGAFRLEGLGKGALQLHAQVTGRGYTNLQLEALAPGEVREGVELKFTASVVVSGTLLDENGAPARFKQLMAMALQGGMNDLTTSGADGSFKFATTAAGKVRISAGDWQNNVELTTVDAPASDLRVTWKAPPLQVIEGLVLDPEGKPVPLCSVTIRPESQPQHQVMYWDGGQGGGPVVNGWFRRQANGKAPFKVEVKSPQDVEGRPLNLKGRTVTVADPSAGPITITLEPGLVIAGRVLDPGGRGVERATVSVGSVSTVTDKQGAFELGGMAEGSLNLTVVPPAPWVRPAPTKVSSGATDVVVRLRAGLAIAGEVRVQGGQPAGQGWVQASWQAAGAVPAGQAQANLNAEGRFRIEGVPEEVRVALHIQVWDQNGDDAHAPKTLRDVRPGTEDLVVDLSGGVAIEGFVVDTHGKPFVGGYVMVTPGADDKHAQSSYVEIKPDGTFKAMGLERGPVRLGLHRNDGGPTGEVVKVEAPATQVKLIVPAATPIRGTLSGGAGVAPNTFRVWAWTTGENKRTTRQVTVGADGKFSLDGVAGGGQWMVGATARRGDSDYYAIAGPFAAGSDNVSLELRQGRSIEGTVVTGDGTDVPAETWVRASSDTWNGSVKVGPKGEFRLRGLPPGRYKVTANTQDGTRVASQDDVDDGASGIRLTLQPQGD